MIDTLSRRFARILWAFVAEWERPYQPQPKVIRTAQEAYRAAETRRDRRAMGRAHKALRNAVNDDLRRTAIARQRRSAIAAE